MTELFLGLVIVFAVATFVYLIPGAAITIGIVVGVIAFVIFGGGALLSAIPWWGWLIIVLLLICGAGKK